MRPALRLFLVLLALSTGIALWLAWGVPAPPTVSIEPRWPAIGPRTPVVVTVREPARGVGPLEVRLVHANGDTVLADRAGAGLRPWWAFWAGPAEPEATVEIDVGAETVEGLRRGAATLRVTVERAGSPLRRPDPAVQELELPVRLDPPALSRVSSHVYVTQGGAEAVVYRVGAEAVEHGVRSGEWIFPGFPLPGDDPTLRFVLFGVPWNLADSDEVRLFAADEIGNRVEIAFLDRFKPLPPRKDTIRLSDSFFAKVVPEIVARSEVREGETALETYLAINRDLRQENAAALVDLAAETAGSFLWNRPFVQLSGSQKMASYADERTYVYEGREVDRQVHLGFDLASVRHAPVEAANSGRVVFAGYLGIYGNTVVVDHGLGLMSLYAHLSSIGVAPGAEVERGAELGRTGETGLAGGDHLHFSVLLRGLPVDPAEWWDPHWLEDRLELKLAPAFQLAD